MSRMMRLVRTFNKVKSVFKNSSNFWHLFFEFLTYVHLNIRINNILYFSPDLGSWHEDRSSEHAIQYFAPIA